MRVDQEKPDYGLRGVRTNRYTFVINQPEEKGKIFLLYDRETDPYQMNNIASGNQVLADELTSELKRWLNKYNDPWLKHLN